MNEPLTARLWAGCFVVGLAALAVIGAWALVAAAASLQGGFTNTTIVPLVVGVALAAVMIGGVVWLVRMALTGGSRRTTDATGTGPGDPASPEDSP